MALNTLKGTSPTPLRVGDSFKVVTIPRHYMPGIIRLTLRAALRLLLAWLIKFDYALQGHRRINPAVIGRHGVIDPVNIENAEYYAAMARIAVEFSPHQNILHLHGHAKYSNRIPRFECFEFVTESAGMKRQATIAGSLTLNNGNDYRKAVITDE